MTAVSLTPKIELKNRYRKELSVTTDISWHRNFRLFRLILIVELLETFWWGSHSRKRNVFDYQVCVFKVRLSVIRAKENLKLNCVSAFNFTLLRNHSVMCLFVTERDFIGILFLVN